MAIESENAAGLPPFEVVGRRSAPAIIVLGGLSANRHICSSATDSRNGWWEAMAGPGRPLDTARYQLVGIDWLDGGCDATNRPARIVTTHDQADAIAAVLDALGVSRAYAIVGSSYGGMVALAFAEKYADRAERLIVIGAAHEPHPMSTAIRSIQRRIVELGLDTGRKADALALARSLAMTTYRSAREFAARFASHPVAQHAATAEFPVESYLKHHGQQFASAWRPERFLALSLSLDLHRISPRNIRTPATFVAAEGDSLVPREQMADLAARVSGPSQLIDLPSLTGHDSFLTEAEPLSEILRAALSTITAASVTRPLGWL
jgi:homoserine O-acetyltransferase